MQIKTHYWSSVLGPIIRSTGGPSLKLDSLYSSAKFTGPLLSAYSTKGVSSIYLLIKYSFVSDCLFPFSPIHSSVF